MSRFPTPEALVSWAGLTPTARQSGPRKGRGKKGHGNTYAKRIAVLAAYAAANTDTFLGRALPPPGLPSRRRRAEEGRLRRGPVHPRHRLAPAERPRRPLPRPRIRTGTPGTPTAAARPATPSASSRPSATTSSSPSGRTPPDPAASRQPHNRHRRPRASACHGAISSCPEPRSRETAEVVISWSARSLRPSPRPADQRIRRSRRISGPPPSAICPWTPSSWAPCVHGRARTSPRTGAEKVTDGAAGSGHADRPRGLPPLTCSLGGVPSVVVVLVTRVWLGAADGLPYTRWPRRSRSLGFWGVMLVPRRADSPSPPPESVTWR